MVVVSCDVLMSIPYDEHCTLLDASQSVRWAKVNLFNLTDEHLILDDLKEKIDACTHRLSLLIAAVS